MTKQKDSHKCNILLQYTIFIGIINMHFSLNRFEQGGFHALEMTEDPVSKWEGDLWKLQPQKRAKQIRAEAA